MNVMCRLLVCVLLLLADRLAAEAGEVRVLGASSMAPVINELGPRFERATGHTLVTRFVSGPGVKQAVDEGAVFDAVVTISSVIDELLTDGKVTRSTRVDVAYSGLGVGVRKGAPRPDIRSVDALKRALLEARAVAYSAEGASGIYFKSLLERLGIADAMQPKLKPLSGARLAAAIPSGEADLIVMTMSAIPGSGAELVGPLPPEIQVYNRFAAAVGVRARDAEAAKALVRFLTTPAAVAVIKAKGMEPGAPR